jgi:hypothetical protein
MPTAANLAHVHRLRREASPPHIALDDTPPEVLYAALRSFEANTPESEAILAERLEDWSRRPTAARFTSAVQTPFAR